MDAYRQFIASKRVVLTPNGIGKIPSLPPRLFPFQRAIAERHLRLGRGAIFAGTGLGKTGMQLAWADAIERDQDGPILILTPLAVAQQTVGRRAIGAELKASYFEQAVGFLRDLEATHELNLTG